MAHSSHYNHLIAVVVAVAVVACLSAVVEASGVVGLDIHHRWSPTVRRWAETRGRQSSVGVQWPAHGSPEYYSELSRHDRALLSRRGLAGAGDGLLAFAAGNATYQLGSLYSAIVSLGTPNATFLVALDTGSDLFWVPCECKQCAPMDNATGGLDLRPYSPRQSTTSKQVTCGHELCNQPNAACVVGNGSCPYTVRYVSPNTSTSGVLVEDVLHLTREGPGGAAGEALQAPIVFGCGQVQTGALLDGDSPDGLLGLGMSRVSIPSVLASRGLVASDSFSMCFGDDGVGRINFGDTGSRDQAETPFILTRGFRPTYNVSFTSVNVGRRSAPVEFAAVMDSGTTFTYLNEPEYTALVTNFNSLVRDRRANFSVSGGSLPFEYCYALSSGQITDLVLPNVSLTTKGGAAFPVLSPIGLLVERDNGRTVRTVGYCLAVIRSEFSINIIGQNFMTGLKVVFNRERSVLGWQEFDCYKNARAADPAAPQAAPAPASSLKPHENNDPNNRNPSAGAVPVVPQPTPSGNANAASQQLSQPLPLLILLVVAAALV